MYRQLGDIDPRYRESAEESLVETAYLMASLIESDIAGGSLQVDALEPVFRSLYERRFSADIYGVEKTRVELRMTVVDRWGTVVFDSRGAEVGADHSQWHDVFLALRGRYGARTTADVEGDPRTSVMYVAAPIREKASDGKGAIVGAVSVGKPVQSFGQFVEAARRKTLLLGATSVVAVALLVMILSVWLVRPFGLIADYVRYVRAQRSFSLPRLGRRALGAIGAAYDEMRDALAGRNYVADYVQTLTHEVKGPLSAIRGAAELLQEPMPDADRTRFIANIARETQRIQELVDRMLELTALESRKSLDNAAPVAIARARRRRGGRGRPVGAGARPGDRGRRRRRRRRRGRRRCLPAAARRRQPGRQRARLLAARRHGDGSTSSSHARSCDVVVSDSGPGIPDYAEHKVFEKFYSLARPGDGEEEHRPGPVVRQGDRRAAPRPRDLEERTRRRRRRDALAAARHGAIVDAAA